MSLIVLLPLPVFAGALGEATARAAATGCLAIVRIGPWFVTARPGYADLAIPQLIAEAAAHLPPFVRLISGGVCPQAAPPAPRGAAGGEPAPTLAAPGSRPPGAGDPRLPAGSSRAGRRVAPRDGEDSGGAA